MAHKFSRDVVDALARLHGKDTSKIEKFEEFYRQQQAVIPGLPDASDITPDEAGIIAELEDFNLDVDKTWTVFRDRMNTRDELERDANNPFLPLWLGKTDDHQTVWVNDTGTLSMAGQIQIRNIIRMASPPLTQHIRELFTLTPVGSREALDPILKAVGNHLQKFMMPLGHKPDNEDFRWSRTVTLMMGFGFYGFQSIAKMMAHSAEEAEWQFYASASEDEIMTAALNARAVSGYPIGLFQADFIQLDRVLARESLTRAPTWYGAHLILHILKHTRFYRNHKGNPYVFVAYKGNHAFMPVPLEGLVQPLNAVVNVNLLTTICNVLQINRGAGKKQASKTPMEVAAGAIFGSMMPHLLTEPLEMDYKPEIIAPKGVTFLPVFENPTEHKWIDPGLSVSNIGRIFTRTGIVEKNVVLTGHESLTYQWPIEFLDRPDLLNWLSTLPDYVMPETPMTVLRRVIKNINDLGFPEGLDALVTASVVFAIYRKKLAGTQIGNALLNEMPVFSIMPMGATLEATTNQGKTNLGRIIGGAYCPSIKVVQASRSASAPSQRAVAGPLEEDGCAIYDEFILPESHEHFLNQAGLQMLCTGGMVTPGRAMENAKGIRLRYPLILVMKVSAVPPDIRNRQVAIFMDALTDENKCSESELSFILSGKASLMLRLSTMRLVEETKLLELLKTAELKSGPYRFNAHYTLALMLADKEQVDGYLAAAGRQCEEQLLQADETGLSDNIGLQAGFDPHWYFINCEEYNLELMLAASQKEPIRLTKFLESIVCDGSKRSLEKVISTYRIKEKAVLNKLQMQMKSKAFKRPGWEAIYVPAGVSSKLDASRHPVSYVELRKTDK